MLTQNQTIWLNKREKELKDLIQKNWPLTDEKWEDVSMYIDKTMNMARDNEEIRKKMFDILEFYDKKANEEKVRNK